jgi:hypothetical protein
MKNKISLEDELANSMMSNLNTTFGHEKLDIEKEAMEAIDMLHSAADIFERAGYGDAAEYITLVISKFGSGQ